MAYQGALRPTDIATLESAREAAEQNHHPALVDIGPGRVAMHVAESGARGGYAFRCDTGPLGETWFFKRAIAGNGWNIRVSVKSLPLATLGIHGVWEELLRKLFDMGAGRPRESIGRVDYAVDFLMPLEFELKPNQFVAHSRASNSEHSYPIPTQKFAPDEFHVQYAGRRASSVTIGKMPGRQIIVYDKRREALQKLKLHWFELWGIDRSDHTNAVWRIEVRAGKKYLNFWHIRTFTDIENQIGDLIANSLNAVRYVAPEETHANISRWPLDPLWAAVQREMSTALFDYRSGIIPERIIEGERQKILANYMTQIISLIPGALIASGYSAAEAEARYPEFIKNFIPTIQFGDFEKFRTKIAAAAKRLHFTRPLERRRNK